jgi:hypothetical protein
VYHNTNVASRQLVFGKVMGQYNRIEFLNHDYLG